MRHLKMNNLLRKKFNNESGMALAMALIIMVVAMFIIVPLLFFTQTTLTVNSRVTESVKAQYAAEAGVEEALWRLGTPGISPQPGASPITLVDRINGYQVTYDVVKPPGKSYSILTSYAYANQISDPASVVRAKLESGLFLFSYAVATRNLGAGSNHDLRVDKGVSIYSLPSPNVANLYSDGEMQFPGKKATVSGTLFAQNHISSDPGSNSLYVPPPWGGASSWREQDWTQVNMWDITPSPDGLPDWEGNKTVTTSDTDVSIGPLHVHNGNLTIAGSGTGRLILNGDVYVDGTIIKTGTQDIVDLSFSQGKPVPMLTAYGDIELNRWRNKLADSSQLPMIVSIQGNITCVGDDTKWICALLYAPLSQDGFISNNVKIFGSINMSGMRVEYLTLEYPSDIQTKKQWPQEYFGGGAGKISAYTIQ